MGYVVVYNRAGIRHEGASRATAILFCSTGRDRHRRHMRMFLTVSFNFLATGHRPCNSGRTKPGRAQPPGEPRNK